MPRRRVVIDHVTVGVSDLARSREFYARALLPLGFSEIGPWREGPGRSSSASKRQTISRYPRPTPPEPPCTSPSRRTDGNRSTPSTRRLSQREDVTTGLRLSGPSTRTATTVRSCSIQTVTTSRLSATAKPGVDGGWLGSVAGRNHLVAAACRAAQQLAEVWAGTVSGERDLDLNGARLALQDAEGTAVLEQVEHLAVRGKNQSREATDALSAGTPG